MPSMLDAAGVLCIIFDVHTELEIEQTFPMMRIRARARARSAAGVRKIREKNLIRSATFIGFVTYWNWLIESETRATGFNVCVGE